MDALSLGLYNYIPYQVGYVGYQHYRAAYIGDLSLRLTRAPRLVVRPAW